MIRENMRNHNSDISNELLAAFLDGNTSAEETMRVLNAMNEDKALQELMDISAEVDQEMLFIDRSEQPTAGCDGTTATKGGKTVAMTNGMRAAQTLPMTRRAANNEIDNLCGIRCEAYVMKALGLHTTEAELMAMAEENGWLKDDGMPLHTIGRMAAENSLWVTRRYDCTMDNLAEVLAQGVKPIVVVDGGELTGDLVAEAIEDAEIGLMPDHAVVVTAYDEEKQEVTIFNPSEPDTLQTYPAIQFVWAWEDSQYYMVTVSNGQEGYVAHPINLDDVELPDELHELQEAIAENVHEIWAQSRQREGWIYGEHRDDAKRTTPDMVPYSKLSEQEKSYDRDTAMHTLKLIRKLGYDIIKKK